MTIRPTVPAVTYVLAVAATATTGFATGSTTLILLAAGLALPASIVAVPAYYVVYGVLALVPGANPDTASGTCSSTGACQTTGGLAPWFAATTDVVGILALSAAAVVNVLLVRLVLRNRAGLIGRS